MGWNDENFHDFLSVDQVIEIFADGRGNVAVKLVDPGCLGVDYDSPEAFNAVNGGEIETLSVKTPAAGIIIS